MEELIQDENKSEMSGESPTNLEQTPKKQVMIIETSPKKKYIIKKRIEKKIDGNISIILFQTLQ